MRNQVLVRSVCKTEPCSDVSKTKSSFACRLDQYLGTFQINGVRGERVLYVRQTIYGVKQERESHGPSPASEGEGLVGLRRGDGELDWESSES
jgi:hypothetical protein